MIRTSNSTNISKIPLKGLIFFGTMNPRGSGKLQLDFPGTMLAGFPGDSLIQLQVSKDQYTEKFSLGTAAAPQTDQEIHFGRSLMFTGIPSCRIRIIEGDTGRILAESVYKSIDIIDDQSRHPMLDFRTSETISEIWKLEISEDSTTRPLLLVGTKFMDPSVNPLTLPRNRNFRRAVIPAVIRQVLFHIIFIDRESQFPENIDNRKWLPWKQWINKGIDEGWFGNFPSSAISGEDGDVLDVRQILNWMDEVVSGFVDNSALGMEEYRGEFWLRDDRSGRR